MAKSLKIVVLLVVLLAVVGTTAFAQQKDPVPAYLLSIFLGFGTGHFYLHDGMGVQFLLLDAAAVATTVTGAVVAVASAFSAINSGSLTGVYVGYGLEAVGGLAVVGFKIWEIVTTFSSAGKMAKNNKTSLAPTVNVLPDGQIAVGVSYEPAY